MDEANTVEVFVSENTANEVATTRRDRVEVVCAILLEVLRLGNRVSRAVRDSAILCDLYRVIRALADSDKWNYFTASQHTIGKGLLNK